MLAINGGILSVFLVVIIAVEVFFLAYHLQIPAIRVIHVVTFSNLCSTLVGAPLVWIFLAIIQELLGGSFYWFGYDTFWQQTLTTIASFPGLTPYKGMNSYHLSLASVILHLVFLVLSYYMERAISLKLLPDCSKSLVSKAVFWGNISTYSIMIPTTIFFIYSPFQGWGNWWAYGSFRFYIYFFWLLSFVFLSRKFFRLFWPKSSVE
jgi:hypothetical protein